MNDDIREAFQSLDFGVSIFVQNKMIFCNKGLENILQYPMEKIRQYGIIHFAEDEEKDKLKNIIRNFSENDLPSELGFWVVTAEGDKKYINNKYYSFNKLGKKIGLVVVTEDKTQEKTDKEKTKTHKLPKFEEFEYLNYIDELIVFYDLDFRILWGNRAASASVNLNQDELKGRKCYELWHRRKVPCEKCPVITVLETAQASENVMETPDGRHWLVRGHPIFDKNQELTGLVEVVSEITEREHALSALEETENRYQTLFNNLADAILIADPETQKLVDCNKQAEELLGYSREEILSLSVKELHPPDVLHETLQVFAEHASGKKIIVESKVLTKYGQEIPVEINSHLMYLDNKMVLGGVFRDISKEKKGELSERMYQTLFEETGTAYTIIDEDSTIIMVNSKFEELSGYSKKELEGKMSSIELGTDEVREKIRKYNQVRVRDPESAPSQYESQIVRKDGEVVDILVNISKTPEVKNYIASILDITEKKKAEKALEESEAKYRGFVENFEGIAFTSISGYKPSLFEGAIEEITGYKKEDFMDNGLTWDKLIHPDDLPLSQSLSYDLDNTPNFKTSIEYRIIRKDGKERWIRQFIQNLSDETNTPYLRLGALYDITESRKAAKALIESEVRYRTLVETSPFGILQLSLDGHCIFANQQIVEMYGYNHTGEILGKTLYEICSNFNEEQIDNILRIAETEDIVYSLQHIAKNLNGDEFPISFSAAVLHDNNGNPYSFMLIVQDMSEQEKAEEMKREAYKQIEDNIASFDVLIDRIRNPLMTIIGTAELEELKTAKTIITSAKKIDEITKLIAKRWEDSERFRKILRDQL